MYEQTAPFYDFFGSNSEIQKSKINFIQSFLEQRPSSLLDIGPGLGEIAMALAAKGHSLYCFEPSTPMHSLILNRIQHLQDIHKNISLFPLKIEDLKVNIQSDLAYASNVFSHLNNDERTSLLAGIYRQLKRDGLLILNCMQPHPERKDARLEKLAEKSLGKIRYSYFASTIMNGAHSAKVTFRFQIEFKNESLKIYQDEFSLYFEPLKVFEEILRKSGFQIEEKYSDFKKTFYQSEGPQLVIVARRI